MPVYIEESEDLVGCYHSGTTTKQTRKDRATQPMDHVRLDEQIANTDEFTLYCEYNSRKIRTFACVKFLV